MSGLIWFQTVCKDYQQTAKDAANKDTSENMAVLLHLTLGAFIYYSKFDKGHNYNIIVKYIFIKNIYVIHGSMSSFKHLEQTSQC